MEHHHDHSGHSHHAPIITQIRKAFVIGIVLNLLYVVVQIIIGFRINSLSLLSDAGHNFLDVAGLALALLAFKLSSSKPTEKYTYGYKKASILITLANAVILLISIGVIGYEAVLRFKNPEHLPGKTIAIISFIGMIINGLSAFLFFKDKDKDINIKSAFLHLAADALVSLGMVAGGVIMYYTHLYWIDPLLSVIICAVIISSTWSLLRDSLRMSMDGLPENINISEIRSEVLKINGVKDMQHLHVWAISTTQNALTAHIITTKNFSIAESIAIKEEIRHELEHHNIQHCTLELETEYNPPKSC